MSGRVFGIKKSTILQISLLLNIFLGSGLILFSLLYLKNPNLWFFIFCIFAAVQSIVKSMLFRLDSACYLGFLLLLIGVSGFLVFFFDISSKYFYLMLAAALASFATFLFTKQKYQLMLGILVAGVATISFLYVQKILNLALFISILLIFLFIFFALCVILFLKYKKGSK